MLLVNVLSVKVLRASRVSAAAWLSCSARGRCAWTNRGLRKRGAGGAIDWPVWPFKSSCFFGSVESRFLLVRVFLDGSPRVAQSR